MTIYSRLNEETPLQDGSHSRLNERPPCRMTIYSRLNEETLLQDGNHSRLNETPRRMAVISS